MLQRFPIQFFLVAARGKVFQPSRGLRQGDPLSPYLFLLCAKGLSTLLNVAEYKGEIRGFKVARNGTSVYQLLFTDDSILFSQDSKVEWGKIQTILQIYKKGSGQMVNKQKSSLYSLAQTQVRLLRRKLRKLGGNIYGNQDRYLGLPILVGRSKYKTFS